MARPNINGIPAFDAQRGTTVNFSLIDDKTYGNRIYVYDTLTLSLVYSNEKSLKKSATPVQTTCIIPSGALKNGNRYYAQVQCLDERDVLGSMSEKCVFYCLTTPHLSFANVEEGKKVAASHLDVFCDYYQANGEKLQSYRFSIYDENRILINESELMFYAKDPDMAYRFKGLASGKKYYVRVQGTTGRGLECDSGLVEINVEYTLKKDFAQLLLENKRYGGYVQIATNIKLIGYNLNNSNYRFISNQYVDLLGADPTKLDYILYDNGFLIEEGFTLWAKHYAAKPNEPIITIYNDNEQKVVISAHRIDNYLYYKLTVDDSGAKYIRYSDRLSYSKGKIVTIVARKYDNNLWRFYAVDSNATGIISEAYSFTQDDNDLYLNATGRMPYYVINKNGDLWTSEEDVYVDPNTGQAYIVIR